MKDVCPIAKYKSFQDCPVLSEKDISNKDQVRLITFPTLVNEMQEVDSEVLRISKTKNSLEAEIKDDTNTEDKFVQVELILPPSANNTIH